MQMNGYKPKQLWLKLTREQNLPQQQMRAFLGYRSRWPENILEVSLGLVWENKSELRQTVESSTAFWLEICFTSIKK